MKVTGFISYNGVDQSHALSYGKQLSRTIAYEDGYQAPDGTIYPYGHRDFPSTNISASDVYGEGLSDNRATECQYGGSDVPAFVAAPGVTVEGEYNFTAQIIDTCTGGSFAAQSWSYVLAKTVAPAAPKSS